MHTTHFIIPISYLRLKLVASRLVRELLADRDMYGPSIEVPPQDGYCAPASGSKWSQAE